MTIRIIDYGSGNLHSVLKAFQLKAEMYGLKAELTQDANALKSASHIVLPGVGAFGDCVAGLNALSGMREALEEAVLKQCKPFFGICVGMQMMLERGLEHGVHKGLGWIKGDVVPLFAEKNNCQEPAKAADPFDRSGTERQTVGDRNNCQELAKAADPFDRSGTERQTVGDRNNCQELAKAADPFDRSGTERQTVGEKLPIPHMGWNNLTPTRDLPLFEGLGASPHVYFVHSYHAQCANASEVLATTDYGQPITACIGRGNLLGTQFHPEKSGAVGLQLIEHFIAGKIMS